MMMATAGIDAILIIVGAGVLWRLIGDIDRATGETLVVTVGSLQSMEDTIEPADGLIGATSESLADVEATLGTVSDSFDAGSTTLGDIGELTGTAEPTLRNAAVTPRQLEGPGTQVDGVLVGLSSVPFGPDYRPEAGLGETFGRLADDLEPLPDEFAATSEGLTELDTTVGRLQADVDALQASVGALNAELAASEDLIDQYRSNVSRAKEVAERSRRDLDRDQTLLRLLLLVGATNFVLAQVVPWWVGRELSSEGDLAIGAS